MTTVSYILRETQLKISYVRFLHCSHCALIGYEYAFCWCLQYFTPSQWEWIWVGCYLPSSISWCDLSDGDRCDGRRSKFSRVLEYRRFRSDCVQWNSSSRHWWRIHRSFPPFPIFQLSLQGTLLWIPPMQAIIFSGTFYGSLLTVFFTGKAIERLGAKAILAGTDHNHLRL